MNLSIAQGLLFWELQSGSVELAQNLSNLLLILYALISLKIDKGCFFAVFLFDEVFSHLSFSDILNESQYYLTIALIYCTLYWYIESKNIRLKTIVACGIIVLFNAGMSLDAAFNTKVETIIYTYYIYIVVFLHLHLISTLICWSLVRKNMGRCITTLWRASGFSDAFTFIWYNSIINR